MKRHSGKYRRYCFKVALMKEIKTKSVQVLLNIVYRGNRAQIESLVIYRKSNSKKHNNVKIEEILNLFDCMLLSCHV